MWRFPRLVSLPAATLFVTAIVCLQPRAGWATEDAPMRGADTSFVRTSADLPYGLGAARTTSTAAVPARPRAKQIAEPGAYLVFATIGDSHFREGGYADSRYIKAMDISGDLLRAYRNDINAHVPPVDFAVHLGDLTDLGSTHEFEVSRRIMDSLTCPLYPVVGNHDNFKSDGKAGWLAFARRDSTTYAFDVQGFHFIVIDCTLNPYQPPYVDCDSTLRVWVAENLTANHSKPTVVLSHYNSWQRHWNAMFDTTLHYAEYRGMPELREVLEDAGNVVAVVNGHVHANRVEKHNGIYYVDVGATLVGPPSVRYFYVYPDRIEVDFEYLSNQSLFDRVTSLCGGCCCCFSPDQVCSFIDGALADRRFMIPLALGLAGTIPGGESQAPDGDSPISPGSLNVDVRFGRPRGVHASVFSDLIGAVDISLHDVLGRRLDHCVVWKREATLEVDLDEGLERLAGLPAGIYFLRICLGGAAHTEKVVSLE